MLKCNPGLYGRSLLRLADLSDGEMADVIELAIALKARRRAGVRGDLLKRRQVALIFEKSSTRTRTSASVAIRDEGGAAEYLSKSDIHLGAKESVKDTARVLGRTFDGI
ncbi:MAG: ornithine carbamoyltransferase, partial [Kiritimatiellae bacterium]|nr:ornithine carbamoyltransferase [Kiritimatiellia bacterium]